MSDPLDLSKDCRLFLSSLARESLNRAFKNDDSPLPGIDPRLSSGERRLLESHSGCFVTLTSNGALRGCIGSIVGYEPLYVNVWRNARKAAFEDPRFRPLSLEEWPMVHGEISVLTEAVPCPDLQKLVIGKHGLILRYGPRTGVFLPQVPVEQGWNTREYLENLCRKAGVSKDCWRENDAEFYTFEATVFSAF
ncbi:MAG: AmmeMemoRadiSam system protein A [Desulfovibrio sp.]|nr:AmmeMemoRadiSam system protein A [Desulfovibrio sp.]